MLMAICSARTSANPWGLGSTAGLRQWHVVTAEITLCQAPSPMMLRALCPSCGCANTSRAQLVVTGQDVGTVDMGGLNSLSGRTGTCHLKCLLFIQKDWADDRCRQIVEGSQGFDASKYLRTWTPFCLFGKDFQRDLWQETLVEPSIVVPPVDWWIEMVINLPRNHIIYI